MLKATAILFKIQGKVMFPCTYFARRWRNFRPRKVFKQDLLNLKKPLIDTFLITKVIISYDNFIARDLMKKSGPRFSFSDFHGQNFSRQ